MCASERPGRALLLLGGAAGLPAGRLLAALPGSRVAAELPEDLAPFGLVLLDVAAASDRLVMRRLLAERLNFCLAEPPGELAGGRLRLSQAARKRRLRPLWLGSWRFRAAAAKAREVAVSGCLGDYVTLSGADEERGRDLGAWLAGAGAVQAAPGLPAGVVELRGAVGLLRLELGVGEDTLRLELAGGMRRALRFRAESTTAEAGLLAYLLRQGGLPGIFPEL